MPLLSSFQKLLPKWPNDRKDTPGHFDSIAQDASAPPANKPARLTPPINLKKNGSSSHSMRKARMSEKAYNGAASSDAGKSGLEPKRTVVASTASPTEQSWYDHEPQQALDKQSMFIASAQSASHSVQATMKSTSGQKVTLLDPGRTFSISIGSHGTTGSTEDDDLQAREGTSYFNRFPSQDSAIRRPAAEKLESSVATTTQASVAELPANEKSSPIQDDEHNVQNAAKSSLKPHNPNSYIGDNSQRACEASTAQDHSTVEFGSMHVDIQSLTQSTITNHSDMHGVYPDSPSLTRPYNCSTNHSGKPEANDECVQNWIHPFTNSHAAEERPNRYQGETASIPEQVHEYGLEDNTRSLQSDVPSRKLQKNNDFQRVSGQNAIAATNGTSNLERRIREVLNNYGVPRKPGCDSLSALVTWISEEMKKKQLMIEDQDTDNDSKKRITKLLKKEVAKLKGENKEYITNLATYKKVNDDLKSQLNRAQGVINNLTQEAAQAREESNQVCTELEQQKDESEQQLLAISRERDEYKHELSTTRLELINTAQELSRVQTSLHKCAKERDDYTQENGQLRHNIEKLRRENRQISAKAKEDLDNARAELSRLAEEYSQTTRQITLEFEHKISQQSQEKQAIIDEKDRIIATQDMRMASYSKPTYALISDGDFGHSFRNLSMKLDNLVDAMPRPQQYVVDNVLDPNNFLGRNAARGNRVWHKFARKACWDIIIQGFFQRQPGFGAFGNEGEGYATLLHLYRLFTPPNTTDACGSRVIFPNNRKTSIWRASTFEAILGDITSTVTDLTVTGFPAFFRVNVRTVADKLASTLRQVCQGELDSQSSHLILELCHEFGVLSLQMGSQQSLVVLETCEYEDWVQAGVSFKDDNNYSETDLQVDIMVQPSLKRIGDGGQDLTTEKVLVIGDVVSLKAGY